MSVKAEKIMALSDSAYSQNTNEDLQELFKNSLNSGWNAWSKFWYL